jgi:aryl-alcohol dehydrogenase-like predicted oxidoreductase
VANALDLPAFAWGPLAEGRLTGKYLSGHTGRVTDAGRPYTMPAATTSSATPSPAKSAAHPRRWPSPGCGSSPARSSR